MRPVRFDARMTVPVLAPLAVGLLAVAAGFQIALAAGAPWGRASYGGRVALASGVLPTTYRCVSGVAAVILGAAIWVVLASSSVVSRGPLSPRALTGILWGLAALFALNTLGNARGLHPVERWGAGTVTAVLAVVCALIAAQ
jgi:hypothetical protein